jgi:hypothetical protein
MAFSCQRKIPKEVWINLSYGIAWGIWLARNDLVFNGRARIWDKIFFSHFASIGFVIAIKE